MGDGAADRDTLVAASPTSRRAGDEAPTEVSAPEPSGEPSGDLEDKAQRLFLAVAVPDEARHAISHRLVATVGEKGIPGRVVPPENWHLTLRFLGWARRTRRERLLAELDAADLGARFRIRLGGLGAFPRPRRATVLWVGVEAGEEELTDLAERVGDAADAAGFEPEDRPFHAHLTLARIRPPRDVTELVETVPAVGVAWEVDEVVLYRSHLRRGGPEYEPVERFPLR